MSNLEGWAGKFIVIEGNDGSGKTTIAKLLEAHMAAVGLDVVRTRQPGGSPAAEKIREMIFDLCETEIDHTSCAAFYLFMAARAAAYSQTIIPALREGKTVISDRSDVATQVYQEPENIPQMTMSLYRDIIRQVTNDHQPHLTIYLRTSPEVSFKRIQARSDEKNAIDPEDLEVHKKRHEKYDRILREYRGLVMMIDADQDMDEVLKDVIAVLENLNEYKQVYE